MAYMPYNTTFLDKHPSRASGRFICGRARHYALKIKDLCEAIWFEIVCTLIYHTPSQANWERALRRDFSLLCDTCRTP